MTLPVFTPRENIAVCRACPSRDIRKIDGRNTAACKHTGQAVATHAATGSCPEKRLKLPPTDKPGTAFGDTLTCRSGANCTLCRQPEGGREWRREMKRKYVTPGRIVDFNCPHGKGWNGSGSRTNDGRRHFVIVSRQGAGDAVSLTGAIRDLHLAYPGVYATAVRSGRMDLFQHNPHLLPEAKVAGKVIVPKIYPGDYARRADGPAPGHTAVDFHARLGQQIGVEIPVLSVAGDVHLSPEEKAMPPEIEGPYWLAWFGGKADFTVKHWPAEHMQRLIDLLRGKVRIVRVGAGGWQPQLDGVTNLLGETSHRRLVRLLYHAQGGIGPVSYGMHLSAAVPTPTGHVRPFIVLAGGGETPVYYSYPGHTVLDTIGDLPCCAAKGCWKLKADTTASGGHPPDCARPVPYPDHAYAQCMTMVTPERAAAAVMHAIENPPRVTSGIDAALAEWRKTHPAPKPAGWAERGPKLWAELHARPFVADALRDDRWMEEFTKRLPCGDCRNHWRQLLRDTPPEYHPPEQYYEWTVKAHNAVNARLGKPQITVAQARLITTPYVAQHGEDRWLAENWTTLELPDDGFYVDVGAADGKNLSNTYWLEHAKGWRGLCIDPNPAHPQLRTNRPAAIIERAAVSSTPGTVSFGLTEEPTHAGILRDDAPQMITVPAVTLTDLLERHRVDRVDLLSIDTEGTELDVWGTLDLGRWRPRIVIVEWNTVGLPDKRRELSDRWREDGYELWAELGGNLIFRDDRPRR